MLVPATCLLALSFIGQDQDWTSRAGPLGNYRLSETNELALTFGADGPKVLWRRPLGDGYSGLLYADERLYAQHREENEEVISALSPATGETLWSYRYPVECYADMALDYGRGPNATPLHHGGRVFAASIDGQLHALDADTGALAWRVDLHERYGRQTRKEEYGFSSSPLVFEGRILLPVGGDVHGVVALDPADGEQVWGSPAMRVSYAQPVLVDLETEQQFVFFSPTAVIGLDPASGDVLWQHPVECFTENNLTPALHLGDRYLWVAGQLDGGTRVLRIPDAGSSEPPEVLWSQKGMTQAHWDSFRMGDFVYGSLGGNSASVLAGVNWRTGEVAWKERGFHLAKGVLAGELFYFIDESGRLVVAIFLPEGVDILAEHPLTESVSWTPPILVGSVLYVRDRKHVLAVELDAAAYVVNDR